MVGTALKIIVFLLLVWFVIYPIAFMLFYFGGASGAYIGGIVFLVVLFILGIYLYKKMSKWYQQVKPKLGTIGYSLFAIIIGCIIVIFSYFFALFSSFVSLFGYRSWMYPSDWWGVQLIFGKWVLLVLIGIGLLFCASIALWIYLKVKENKLRNSRE
jgi:hypothetical protein